MMRDELHPERMCRPCMRYILPTRVPLAELEELDRQMKERLEELLAERTAELRQAKCEGSASWDRMCERTKERDEAREEVIAYRGSWGRSGYIELCEKRIRQLKGEWLRDHDEQAEMISGLVDKGQEGERALESILAPLREVGRKDGKFVDEIGWAAQKFLLARAASVKAMGAILTTEKLSKDEPDVVKDTGIGCQSDAEKGEEKPEPPQSPGGKLRELLDDRFPDGYYSSRWTGDSKASLIADIMAAAGESD